MNNTKNSDQRSMKKRIFEIELESVINIKKMLTAKNLIFFAPEKKFNFGSQKPSSRASAVFFTKIERLSNVLVGNLDRLELKLESNPQQKFQLSYVSRFLAF